MDLNNLNPIDLEVIDEVCPYSCIFKDKENDHIMLCSIKQPDIVVFADLTEGDSTDLPEMLSTIEYNQFIVVKRIDEDQFLPIDKYELLGENIFISELIVENESDQNLFWDQFSEIVSEYIQLDSTKVVNLTV